MQKQVSNDKNYRSKNSRHQILKSQLGNRTFQVHRQLLNMSKSSASGGQVLAYVVERSQIKNRLTRCLGPLFTNWSRWHIYICYIYIYYIIYIIYCVYIYSFQLLDHRPRILPPYRCKTNTFLFLPIYLGLKEASWSQAVPQSELASSKRRSMECRQWRSTTPPVRWAPDGPGWTIAEWLVNFLVFYGAAA